MSTIVNIQYLGPNQERTCILNTGEGIPANMIDGEASVGKTVEYFTSTGWSVTSGASETCST